MSLQKSISAWAFEPARPASELFQIARDNGFTHVEVALGDNDFPLSFQVTADSTRGECEAVREAAQNAGVSISSLACGLGWDCRMSDADSSMRARSVELHQKALQVAAWLGVDALLALPGGVWASFIPGFPITPYRVAWENTLESLRLIAPVAEEVGVSLALENVWNSFLLSPLEFRGLLDEVNSPRVGAYFDVGNVVIHGFPEQWIEILAEKVVRVHFKDFKRVIGTLDGFCALGDGDTNWAAVVAALASIGYHGPVTAEFFNCENDIPDIAVRMDKILAI